MLPTSDRADKQRRLHAAVVVLLALSMSAILVACSAWTSSTNSSDSTVTHFGYNRSPLLATVVSPNASVAASSNYFGMTIHRLVANPSSSLPVAPFPAFPIHTFRLWDVVNWTMLESSNGKYDWTTMDETIAIAKQNGVSDFVFTFGDVPRWAFASSSDPCPYCNAPNRKAFDEFVTHVVQRYCGVVQYYETWNEPNLKDFWNGTNSQLLSISSDLYRISKDPENCGCQNGSCTPGAGLNPNQVLLPSINSINQSNLSWLDAYLATSGSTYPYADVVAFHGYGYKQPEDIVQGVAQLKNVLARHGLSSLELWDTEANWGETDSNDQHQEASWLMRFHVAQATAGVSRFVWYAYDNCSWGTLWGTTCGQSADGWQGVRWPGDAYATIENWMLGATLTHCDIYKDGLWACELQRSGVYQGWILWDSTGTGRSVPIPNKLQLSQYRNWQDHVSTLPQEITVDDMPVIIEN